MTLAQDALLVKYEQYMVDRGLRPRYVSETMIRLRVVARSVNLNTATAERITACYEARQMSLANRELHTGALRGFYKWCIEVRQDRSIDPSWAIPLPRRRPLMLPRAIPDDDLQKALANAEPRMRVLLLLGCLAGLRCCEIGGLRREDVSEAQMTLRVTQGKGGHERVVPLHPDLLEALKAWGMPEGPLFKRRDLRGMTGRRISQMIGEYLHSLGIDSSAHQLRHWHATALYRETLDIRLVQNLLGHRSILTTQRYAAADSTKAAGAVNGLRADTREPRFQEVS